MSEPRPGMCRAVQDRIRVCRPAMHKCRSQSPGLAWPGLRLTAQYLDAVKLNLAARHSEWQLSSTSGTCLPKGTVCQSHIPRRPKK